MTDLCIAIIPPGIQVNPGFVALQIPKKEYLKGDYSGIQKRTGNKTAQYKLIWETVFHYVSFGGLSMSFHG
jgi:hypothetical protein